MAEASATPPVPPTAAEAEARVEGEGGEGQELSAKQRKKLEKKRAKEAAKAAKAAEREAREKAEAEERAKREEAEEEEARENYGDAPLIQSGATTDRVWTRLDALTPEMEGQRVLVRGYVFTSRNVGKSCFLLLRQAFTTVQALAFKGPGISSGMIRYMSSIPNESIVDVEAEVMRPNEPVESASAKNLELHVKKIFTISRAEELPFQVEDASRPEAAAEEGHPTVHQDTRLNYRWVDLRTLANQAIFRVQSGVCALFREFLSQRGFIEMHTPKTLGGASEGGAEVFRFQYFNRPACLAQSPQLYKQICAACAGYERVFEVGPVFRAEDSNTNRHLCEFTGLDFEMAINEHYYEALDVMSDLFIHIFDGINERFGPEMEAIREQFPFEPIQYLRPSLRLTFAEGMQLLREAGEEPDENADLSTPHEKLLGRIVKEKYGTDFYMLDRYPLAARPFYTMPCPDDPTLSNSYDLFIRGEEIVSGAQRIHDPSLLVERATANGIPLDTIQSYLDAFRHGAQPHAGGGIGLERVVMLFLGLPNIRRSSMFPRDPKRLAP